VSPRARDAVTALVAATLFLLVDVVLCRTRIGQQVDARVFSTFVERTPEGLRRVLDDLARPSLLFGLAAALALLALRCVAREPRRVGVAVVALLAAPVAHTIRSSWTRPDLGVPGYADNTFPSTHAAAGIALLLGCLILWPRPLARPEALGATLVAVVTLSGNVAWYAHRPADSLGGALLSVAVTAFASALLDEPLRWRARRVGDSPAATRTGGAADVR
jgi:membrane-associated phospholipid phosphatase